MLLYYNVIVLYNIYCISSEMCQLLARLTEGFVSVLWTFCAQIFVL